MVQGTQTPCLWGVQCREHTVSFCDMALVDGARDTATDVYTATEEVSKAGAGRQCGSESGGRAEVWVPTPSLRELGSAVHNTSR